MNNSTGAARPAAARLGKLGIWSGELRTPDSGAVAAAVEELEQSGWSTVWIPGGIDNQLLNKMDRLIAASANLNVATGILNIWKHTPQDVATWWSAQRPRDQQRIMLGLGVSHGPAIGDAYRQPVKTMREYVLRLREAGLPQNSLCLAALGPKMLELSAELTAGAHPFLVSPEHTRQARAHLGANALLAPEQGVVLESDPARARQVAREALAMYRDMPNYANTWRRLGFSEDDISELSDKLIDSLIAHGGPDAIRKRVSEHLDAGADHVCLQVIDGTVMGNEVPQAAWRQLAQMLL